MSPLVRIALEVLEDDASAPGLRQVAGVTILAAFEAGVEVAPGSHAALWRYLLGTGTGASVLARYEIADQEVARDAIRILIDDDAGEDAGDLALGALRGSNVRYVTDEDLVSIADRLTDEGKARRLTWLTERVNEERGLSPEILVGLRDRLAGADDPSVRAGAVEIAGLAARLDEAFAIRMLDDSAPPVRAAVADLLEKVDVLDRPLALVIVRRQLDVERHRSVLSALHYCMGSLVRGARRIRTWEPPSGMGN